MKRIIVVCFFVLAFLISVPGYADKPPVRPILYTYYRQLGWGDSVQIGYVDSNGDLWALKGNDSFHDSLTFSSFRAIIHFKL